MSSAKTTFPSLHIMKTVRNHSRRSFYLVNNVVNRNRPERVELECAKVCLLLNTKKTEVITYNIPQEHPPLTTIDGTALNEISDFKYLGAWVNSTERDLKVRKALAWRALNGMTSVWKSNLPRHIKISFFSATVESILLYGSDCWSLTQALQKSLDGCFTRMLRVVLNTKQGEHITNK